MNELHDSSVQLVYLDPPFNSGRNYDAGLAIDGAHRTGAFVDTWAWGDVAETALEDLRLITDARTADRITSLVGLLDRCSTAAYLAMMAPRLATAHRLLTSEGSLYLHCDPSASHYLKALLDLIFGQPNFRNEITWKRTHAHSGSRRYGPVHDTILYYTKTDSYIWNQGYSPYTDHYIERYFTKEDERGRYQLITCTGPGDRTGTRAHYRWRGHYPPPGRHWAWTIEKMEEYDDAGLIVHSSTGVPRLKRYTTDGKGVRLQDIWTDINPLGAHAGERTGFDTQKPISLLERIVFASSEPGGTVIDPFGGSGTTAVACERLGRSWITTDLSLMAASLTLSRVRQEIAPSDPVPVRGFPDSTDQALELRREAPAAFAAWATAMLGTVLRRDLLDTHVAAGEGKLTDRDDLTDHRMTWVPLSDRLPQRAKVRAAARGLDTGIVVHTGGEALALADRLRRKGFEPHLIELGLCVAKDARERGLVGLPT